MCVKGAPEMTGYRSKKMMSDVRWLGPYAPAVRHADDITIAHVVELRKKLADAERHRDNALEGLMALKKERDQFRDALINIQFEYNRWKTKASSHFIGSIAKEALKDIPDGKRAPTIKEHRPTIEESFRMRQIELAERAANAPR